MADLKNTADAIEQYENIRLRADIHFNQAAQVMKNCLRDICSKAGVPYSDEYSVKMDGIIEDIKTGVALEIRAEQLRGNIQRAGDGRADDGQPCQSK